MKINTKHIDWVFWTLLIILAAISLTISFTASAQKTYAAGSILPVLKHAACLVAAIGLAALVQYVPSVWIRVSGWVLLAISDIMLYLIMIPGFPLAARINGATRWFRLGPITIQPSELAKIAIVIVVADLISRARTDENRKRAFWYSLAATAVTVIPILSQNLSTAVLICAVVFVLWWLGAMPWKHILATSGVAIGVGVLFLFFVDVVYVLPHRSYNLPFLTRSVTWCGRINQAIGLSDEDEHQTAEDAFDHDRQKILCRVAVARGGASPLGVGIGHSREARFLPLADADCVFAILVEEWGIVGAGVLMAIYLIILFRACVRSWQFSSGAALLMVMGLALMITLQALISMMVVVGLGPVTGQPLPLISTGGTTIIFTGITFGILLAVSREQSIRASAIHASAKESQEAVPDIHLES